MKKKLLITALILMITSPAFAVRRGLQQNYFASWVSVGNSTSTITLPGGYKTRDIYLQNGSSQLVCVSLDGSTITHACTATATTKLFQLNDDSNLFFQDYGTKSISFRSVAGATASPVSIITTY